MSLGVNHHETLAVDHTQGNQTVLAVVLAVVAAGEDRALEDQRRIDHVDPTLLDDQPTLVLVPFEIHPVFLRMNVFVMGDLSRTRSPVGWTAILYEKYTKSVHFQGSRAISIPANPSRPGGIPLTIGRASKI